MPAPTHTSNNSTTGSSQDTYSYKGWMNSDSFLKRSFGVLGYYMVSSCIIQAVVMTIFVVFGAIFGIFGAMMNN